MRWLKSWHWMLAVLLMAGVSSWAMAQTSGPSGPGGPGGGGGWGGMNRQQMRQRMEDRMLNRLKTELNVADDVWAVLKPKIQKIQELRFQSRASMFMGGPGRHRHGHGANGQTDHPSNSQSTNPVVEKTQALRALLADPNSTPDQIKAGLGALRQARKDAAAKLKAAQDDLRELLTVRQEAVLVLRGILN